MAQQDRPEGASHLAVTAWESMFRAQSQLFAGFADSSVWQGRSMREYDVLYQLSLLARDQLVGGACQRDLAARLLISQPSLSRLVDKLVAEGLIDRQPDPNDGRVALLTLTAEGAALQRRIGLGHAADVARAMRSRLSDDELVTLREITTKLAADAATGETGQDRPIAPGAHA